jgi:hypothetical protein
MMPTETDSLQKLVVLGGFVVGALIDHLVT